jgi:pimeloyl-ACP methyl ester carboxylesterase
MTTPQTKTATTAEMTTGSVVSKDGTRIGYLRVGRGPAVVLLHGSNESARSHTQLALALADTFTVYLPDRRGRGMSGPHRPDHSIRTEVQDLQAALTESGAQKVLGASVSALIVLQAARTQPAIRQIAAYEPALLMDRSTRYTGWVRRFDQELAQGNVAAAEITSMYGLDLAPPAFKRMPRPQAEALTNMAMDSEDKQAASDTVTVTMRKLAPPCATRGCCSRRRPAPSAASPRCPPRCCCSAATWSGRPSSSPPSRPSPRPSRTTGA